MTMHPCILHLWTNDMGPMLENLLKYIPEIKYYLWVQKFTFWLQMFMYIYCTSLQVHVKFCFLYSFKEYLQLLILSLLAAPKWLNTQHLPFWFLIGWGKYYISKHRGWACLHLPCDFFSACYKYFKISLFLKEVRALELSSLKKGNFTFNILSFNAFWIKLFYFNAYACYLRFLCCSFPSISLQFPDQTKDFFFLSNINFNWQFFH